MSIEISQHAVEKFKHGWHKADGLSGQPEGARTRAGLEAAAPAIVADLAETFEQMADAAEKDAEGFWPGAPLYAAERSVAAATWRRAAKLLRGEVVR